MTYRVGSYNPARYCSAALLMPAIGQYQTLLDERYDPHLRHAFEAFCDLWLHCAFRGKSERCCNVKSSHGQKGHQGAGGKPLGKGPFELEFSLEESFGKWKQSIQERLQFLESLRSAYGKGTNSAEEVAARIHRKQIGEFLSKVRRADFVSHHTCLCCLRHSMPEYSMPCGQAICAACMKTFRGGSSGEDPSSSLTRCPFCSTKDCLLELDEKPLYAGVRILCLDG